MSSKNKGILSDLIIGLEKQKSLLENLLLEFKLNGQGGSCLLSGRQNSGKTLILDTVIARLFPKDGAVDDILIEKIDGNDFNNFSVTNKLFEQYGLAEMSEKQRDIQFGHNNKTRSERQNKMPKNKRKEQPVDEVMDQGEQQRKIIFIVDHFENFAKKNNQSFLYGILNGSQTCPWFVLLIGTTENSVTMLEKRVRSRLSKIRIDFNMEFSFDDFQKAFFEFIQCSSIPKAVAKRLEADESTICVLNHLYQRRNGICLLKELVQLFELIYPEHANNLENVHLLELCLEAILPENKQQRILDGLPVRKLCLLNCALRLEEIHRRIEHGYREITTEYYRFINEYDKSMRVQDIVLFKDLNELVDDGLLVPVKKAAANHSQLQFRKVIANVEKEAISTSVEKQKRNTPARIVNWFNSSCN